MKIGVLGSGAVGRTLADGFLKHGHTVKWSSRLLHGGWVHAYKVLRPAPSP